MNIEIEGHKMALCGYTLKFLALIGSQGNYQMAAIAV
jgi:hypothetical protein